MSFREKMHWIAFVALLLAFGWYFLSYPWVIIDTPEGGGVAAGMLVPVTIFIAGLMTVLTAVIAEPVRVGAQLYYYRKGI